MGESRTPRPNGPIEECTTGLVDVLFYASDSHRPDSSALALWSLMTIRRRSSSAHPMLSTPSTNSIGGSWVDDAYCFLGSKSVDVCRFVVIFLSVGYQQVIPTT